MIVHYQCPERQTDLRYLKDYIPRQFKNMKVLGISLVNRFPRSLHVYESISSKLFDFLVRRFLQ